jgi:hypothetical protein
MSKAFVCGNGVSRKDIDLSKLKSHGSIYGCNAMYREFAPDCLIATDRAISEQIQKSGYSKTHRFYTRRPLAGFGAVMLPKKYYGNSSGPNAIALAALDGHETIYLLGFDMGPTVNAKFNNVYAGSEFYKPIDAAPTYTGNWIRQISAIALDFPTAKFIRVLGSTTAKIADFSKLKNFQHIAISEFCSAMT